VIQLVFSFIIGVLLLSIIFLTVTLIARVITHGRKKKATYNEQDNQPAPNKNIKIAATYSEKPSLPYAKQAEFAEDTVDGALRQLQEGRYFVFRDLIIPSASKSMSLTQIDHVVVSQKGIFCIETKSNHGNIYGFTRSEQWNQYLGQKPYKMNSPFRQNNHHVSSLERLLSDDLRAPIHSYVAFPNAKKVIVDKKMEDMTPAGIIEKICHHDRIVYQASDVERIAKVLAHAGTFREQLRDRHIEEVKAFIDAKVSRTLKLS